MTHGELINDGWESKPCKIGTLYFKGGYFIRLDGEKARVHHNSDDMHPLGYAETFDEIKDLQQQHELTSIHTTEMVLAFMIHSYEQKYGEKYNG